MLSDLRHAVRMLVKSRSFTLAAWLTLALGIGANTAIFSLINTTFLRALPYPDPDSLVRVAERRPAIGETIPVSYPNFLDWQRRQDAFSALAIYQGQTMKLRTAQGAELVSVRHVSAQFFDLFGARPVLGRAMRPEDDAVGAERVAWIADDAWRRLFGGDPGLVGRSLVLDGRSVVVAGILPEGFRFYRGADLTMAIAPFARELFLDMRQNRSNCEVLGRLKSGVAIATAQAHMDVIARRLADEYPQANAGIQV